MNFYLFHPCFAHWFDAADVSRDIWVLECLIPIYTPQIPDKSQTSGSVRPPCPPGVTSGVPTVHTPWRGTPGGLWWAGVVSQGKLHGWALSLLLGSWHWAQSQPSLGVPVPSLLEPRGQRAACWPHVVLACVSPIHGNGSYPESRDSCGDGRGMQKGEKSNKCCKWHVLGKSNWHRGGGLGKEKGMCQVHFHCASNLIFGVQGWGVIVVLEGISSIEGSCFKTD